MSFLSRTSRIDSPLPPGAGTESGNEHRGVENTPHVNDGITGGTTEFESVFGEERDDIPRILGIVCRGGEGGVKGLDRAAAA